MTEGVEHEPEPQTEPDASGTVPERTGPERTGPEPAGAPTARGVMAWGFPAFVLAFLFLLGSVVGLLWGQFTTSHFAPLLLIGCSVVAVTLTVVALWLRPRR